ncbi:MAG: hypothetical protein QXO00_04955 [Candidatus Bathyarchaeia archaeon]
MTSKTQNIQNQNLNILLKKLEQVFEEATTDFVVKGDTYYYIWVNDDDELKTVAKARLTFKLKRETFLKILEEIKQKFAEKNFNEEDIGIGVKIHTYTKEIEVYADVQTGLDYAKDVRVIDLRDLTKEQYQEYLRELEMLRKIVEEQEKIVAKKNNEIRKEKELKRLKEIENSYVKLKDENYKLKKIIQKLVDKEQLQEELAENEEDEEEEERELTKEEKEFILQKVL